MPKLPQYTANLTSPSLASAQVDPRAAAAPYTALGNVGESLVQTGGMVASLVDERKRQEGAKLAAENHSVFTRKVAEWMDQNDTREDYGEAFQKFSDELSKSMVSTMTNNYAKEAFHAATRDDVDRKLFSALKIGEQNRFKNMEFSEQESAVANAVAFRSYHQQDPEGAAQLARHDIETQRDRIAGAFGQNMKAAAGAVMESTTIDTITGIMEVDPALALELVDEYPMDEKKRRTLRNEAQSKIGVRDALEVQRFSQSIKDAFADAEQLGSAVMLPSIEEYEAVLKNKSIAAAEREQDKVKADIYNGAVFAVSSIKGKSPEEMYAQLKHMRDNGKGEVGKGIYDASVAMVNHMVKERDYDVSAYIRKYNPAIQELESQKQSASPEKAMVIEKQIASAVLRYQGPPPPPDTLGNQPRDKGYYQNLPSHQIKILTKAQAADYAAQLNQGTPDQQVAALARFDLSFDEDTKHIAWRDLTSLPAGSAVKQSVQLASLHLGTDVAKQLLSSVKNFDENVKRKGVEISKYTDELKWGRNKNWDAFNAAYGADLMGAPERIAGFKDAIVAYAVGLDIKNPNEAIKLATSTLLESKFHFESVGKELVPFAKWNGPGGRDWTDEEMKFSPSAAFIPAGATVGIVPAVKERFLNLDFSNVRTKTPEGINLFPAAPPGVSDATLSEYLNTQLPGVAMLKPSEDGKGFYVYMRNELSRIDTQLFTKDNRPLFIPYLEADPRRNAPQRKSSLTQPDIYYPAP